MEKDDRGLIAWKVQKKSKDGEKNEEILYTEELIAMLLKYGKFLSEKQAGGTVKDCVLTIPSYFTPTQKRMMQDAAELAGLSILQMIHENTAAATLYGIDRLDSDKTHTVMFYNMGGTDTEVSIVRYSTITDPQANKTYEYIDILAESYVKDFGGYNLDLVLVDMIAERFNALKERKDKPDVRTYEKVVKRLLKEVVKIKDVLSANKNMQIKLGELQDYVTL